MALDSLAGNLLQRIADLPYRTTDEEADEALSKARAKWIKVRKEIDELHLSPKPYDWPPVDDEWLLWDAELLIRGDEYCRVEVYLKAT